MAAPVAHLLRLAVLVCLAATGAAWPAEAQPQRVLSLGSIALDGGQTVPVLGANPPSFIWYPAQQLDARALAMNVMKQDLITACWQAIMAGGAAPDASATLKQCTDRWDARSVFPKFLRPFPRLHAPRLVITSRLSLT